jgi:hypothetical protein
MSITLTVAATTVQLPPDLYWSDEHAWSPVEQAVERSITGALIVSTGLRAAGRPITLQPRDDGSAWMPHAVLQQLRAWGDVPGQQMQLSLRGAAWSVAFRHHDEPAIQAEPVVHYSDVNAGDFYLVTLRLMET